MEKNQSHNRMAKFAYEKIKSEAADNKEFCSLSRSFPSMLQANGLGAAIAFLFSKGNSTPHKLLYEMINQWTKEQFGESEPELMARITDMDSAGYRLYTDEIMALCLWIKRFSEGMIGSNE